MASDDVIELGSSDEDTEPAPKKKKPPPNPMVHIPSRLPGITIKPTKSSTKINPESIIRGSIGKSVTVTKVPNSNVNPYAKKINGKSVKVLPSGKRVQIPVQKSLAIPIVNNTGSIPLLKSSIIHKTGINPLNRTEIKTYSSNSRATTLNTAGVNPLNIIKIMKPAIPVKLPDSVIKGQSQKNISKLLPGITVKRTTPNNFKPNNDRKRVKVSTLVHMTKPAIATSNEVLTVDLDDDEPSTSSAPGPQWYLRPEEAVKAVKSPQMTQDKLLLPLEDKSPKNKKEKTQEEVSEKSSEILQKQPALAAPEQSNLEHQNNKEPDKTTFIEITIEDSPIKPAEIKKCFKADLAIIIEDSPVKGTTDKNVPNDGSDNEKAVPPKEPNSKKKLEYPKNLEMLETLEIEFEPLEVEFEPLPKPPSNKENNEEKPKRIVEVVDVVEIEESSVKPEEIILTTTLKKNRPAKPSCKMAEVETVFIDDKEKNEFHPIYQSFINLCFQLENSEDMKKIVEKKIKAYYLQVPKEYTVSETFTDMVSSKIMAMKAGPEKMYLYIKDVVDELNLQRKLAKAQPPEETKNEEQEKFLYGEESEFDSKRQRQIRKLEKTLKKLHRAIQKLEEQEVDFDDEEDSVYILTDSEDDTSSKADKPLNKEVLLQRYKERMVRVHAKLCQLTNTKMPSESRVQLAGRPGQPPGPARRLEKWINRKVPIGTPLPFPDFHDVLRCVRDANQEDKLGWNEADIMEEARDLFTRCGKKLQRRRQENEWRLAASRIAVDCVDPAENSSDLKKKLEENKQVAAKKETEVFNKYADRQNQLKLEAVEIGDMEAEESPVESDDEETVDDHNSLISKEKRKECLKRLLQEKSKKSSDKKENQPNVQAVENTQNKDTARKDSNEAKNVTNGTDKQTATNKETENKDSLEFNIPNLSHSKNKDDNGSDPDIKNKEDNKQSDKVHSLSDDSNKVESDIDELHLLQKLYSENELNTSVMDSDSGTPIAISSTSSSNDILSSDERRNKGQSSDVISIENSSYSDSEEKKDHSSKDTETDCILTKVVIEETVDANMEIECSNYGVGKKTNKNNNHEYNQSLEDILLASSDEADDTEVRKDSPEKETFINLRDDSISIGETIIEDSRTLENGSEEAESKSGKSDNNGNTSFVEGMEIGPTESHSEEQNGLAENIGEISSVKSTDEGSITEITSVKSTEPNEEEHAAETTSIRSVEIIANGNTSETTDVKSVENIEEGSFSETSGVKSVETIEDENNDTTGVKSVESIEEGNFSETSGVKSVETIEDENNDTTGVKSVESIEEGNFSETSGVKSVETIEDENNDTTGVKSVESIEEGNFSETSGVKSVETIEDENNDTTGVKSVESIEKGNFSETSGVKSVETIEDENNDTTGVKSVESIEKGNFSETSGVKSVETIKDENNDPTGVQSGESVEDDNISETTGVKSVETIEDENIYDTTSVKSAETVKDANECETRGIKSLESIEYKTIMARNIINDKENAGDITEIADSGDENKGVEKIKESNVAIPEAMEVDSND